jgi:PAS domain S-box-containing protein
MRRVAPGGFFASKSLLSHGISVTIKPQVLPDQMSQRAPLQADPKPGRDSYVRQSTLEAALVQSEQRFRSLFEESRDPIYFTRVDGTFIDANRSFLELFGYSHAELLSVNAQELYADPLERLRFRREVEARHSVRDFEVMLRTRAGRILDCLLSSAAHFGPGGELLWYQGMIHDITARKSAEKALARSEHFARTIVSSVGEGVIVYDRDLKYQVWNRFMEELTGMPADQVIGQHALDVFPHLRQEGIDELLKRALQGETVRSMILRMPCTKPGRLDGLRRSTARMLRRTVRSSVSSRSSMILRSASARKHCCCTMRFTIRSQACRTARCFSTVSNV